VEEKQYRVDNIPILIRPFFLLASLLIAIGVYSLLSLGRLLCRVEYRGKQHLSKDANYIYAMWHDGLIPYFIVNVRYSGRYVWLNHPAWFMKPIHFILYMMGTEKIVLGSSGNSGKEALVEVVSYLQQGYNTTINPDGPIGPVKELKEGVLNMAVESGIEVVPLRITTNRAWVLESTWDHKRIPKPFSKIIVEFGEPVTVTEENYEVARNKITSQL